MLRLTKTIVESATPRERQFTLWCGELPGFGVYVHPTGKRTYFVDYRNELGARKRMTIGRHGKITTEEARKIAIATLGGVVKGQDPATERATRRSSLTVRELCDRYLEAARAGLVMTRFRKPKRASTVAVDEGRIARHIVPLIGGRIAAEITRPDVQRMADAIAAGKTAVTVKTRARGVARVTGGAGTAARVVELFGGIWTWAEKRGVVSGRNPAHGVETQRGQAKDRVLSRAELASLGKAIDAAAERYPQAASALRLIVLTGMRREEAVGLRWREVDLDGSSLRLEATKSGRSTRPIGKAAVEHLKAVPATNEEWVFPNRSGDGSADLKRQIAAIFDAAGLKDARSHDTRRTFASVAAELEYGDATIAELIGHARRGVTERHYVRRPDATLIAAADRVARVIDGYMSGTEAKIVAMSRKEMNRRE